MQKCAMKVEVIVLDSTTCDDKDDTNFVAFVASNIVVDPLTATLDFKKVTIEANDDHVD